MRRLFAFSSAVLSVTFAIALANAGGTSMNTPGVDDMAGMAGTPTPGEKAGKKAAKGSKSCTMNGVTYKKGEPGFEQCKQRKDMGGSAGMETPDMESAGQTPDMYNGGMETPDAGY